VGPGQQPVGLDAGRQLGLGVLEYAMHRRAAFRKGAWRQKHRAAFDEAARLGRTHRNGVLGPQPRLLKLRHHSHFNAQTVQEGCTGGR
jgi:hypothetical protein